MGLGFAHFLVFLFFFEVGFGLACAGTFSVGLGLDFGDWGPGSPVLQAKLPFAGVDDVFFSLLV